MIVASLAALSLFLDASAAADVPPERACDKEGASCTTPKGVAGVCQRSRCGRFDPKTKKTRYRECLRCRKPLRKQPVKLDGTFSCGLVGAPLASWPSLTFGALALLGAVVAARRSRNARGGERSPRERGDR